MQLFCWQKSIYGNTEHNCQSCHNGAFQFDSSQNVTLNWVKTNIFAHFTTGINFANEVTGLRWDPSSRVTKMSHFSKIFIALSSFRFDRKKNSSRWTSPLSLTASLLFFFFGLIDNCYNYKQSIFGSSHRLTISKFWHLSVSEWVWVKILSRFDTKREWEFHKIFNKQKQKCAHRHRADGKFCWIEGGDKELRSIWCVFLVQG